MYFLVYNLKSNKQTFIDFILIIIKEPNNRSGQTRVTNHIGGRRTFPLATQTMVGIDQGQSR